MQRENDGNLYRTDFRRNNPTAIFRKQYKKYSFEA